MGKVWVNIPVMCLKRPGDQCAWPMLYIVIDLNIATIAKEVWWHSFIAWWGLNKNLVLVHKPVSSSVMGKWELHSLGVRMV